MSECTCHELPPEMWTTHYGAVEPGSMYEPNPNCTEHFPRTEHCTSCDGTAVVMKADYTGFIPCPQCTTRTTKNGENNE